MDRRQISFIKFILEAYDNLAIVSTVDADKAVIEIRIAPGCEGEVDDLLDSFAGQVKITPIGQQEQHHGGGRNGSRGIGHPPR